MVKLLKEKEFEKKVLKSKLPVLVDFYSEWCPPCKMLASVIEEVASEMREKLKVFKVDVQKEPRLASHFEIVSVPTIILFKKGREIKRWVGFQTKEELLKKVERNL
jgi:thioredoxin 1